MKTHYNTPGRTYVRRVATHQYVNVNVNVSCGHVYMYMGAGIALRFVVQVMSLLCCVHVMLGTSTSNKKWLSNQFNSIYCHYT